MEKSFSWNTLLLHYPEIEFVRFELPDTNGVSRGKIIPKRHLEKYEIMRDDLEHSLIDMISNGEGYEKKALKIISCQNDPKDTFTRVMLKMEPYHLGSFAEEYRKEINNYLDEATEPIVINAIVKYHQKNLRNFVTNEGLDRDY